MNNPFVSPSVGLCQVEDGYLAYDAAARILHELNPVAALLLELADGTRSTEEIVALAAPLIPGENPAATVRAFVEEGLSSGLLSVGDGTPRTTWLLTADEIREAGNELWQLNRPEAALKLARRVAELEPQNALAWFQLGQRAQWLGLKPGAIDAYRRYLEINPDDDAVAQMLAGLEGGPPPPRCSDRCIELIFESFAEKFDEHMRGALCYQTPERIEEILAGHLDGRDNLDALDLGCGTGLLGALLRKRVRRLTGVDLSPAMAERARALGAYDAIEIGEIHAWLEACEDCFDLITSADCLVYVGDLGRIVRLASSRLKPGGWLAYSVEKGDTYPLELKGTGRYTHHRDHLAETALAAGLDVIEVQESFLRNEGGQGVTGWLVLLRRPMDTMAESIAHSSTGPRNPKS